jgi:hypothetical protein
VKRKIEKALTALGHAGQCFPIDIFSVSRMIADTQDPAFCQSLIKKYGHHSNAFVRRCMLVAIRFIGGDFPSTVSGYISRSLSDENAWVRYDAAWVIKDFGSKDRNDFNLLRSMAGKFLAMKPDELDKAEVEGSDDYAARMAAQAVCAHEGGASEL